MHIVNEAVTNASADSSSTQINMVNGLDAQRVSQPYQQHQQLSQQNMIDQSQITEKDIMIADQKFQNSLEIASNQTSTVKTDAEDPRS